MEVSVKIYIYGDGASSEQADRIQSTINNEWNKGDGYQTYHDDESGQDYGIKFNVSVELYNEDNPTDVPSIIPDEYNPFSTSNYIELTNEKMRSFVTGGDEGKWYTGDNDLLFSHEFAHLIGLKDRYTDQVIDGTKRSVPNSGYEDNIMGSHKAGGFNRRILML